MAPHIHRFSKALQETLWLDIITDKPPHTLGYHVIAAFDNDCGTGVCEAIYGDDGFCFFVNGVLTPLIGVTHWQDRLKHPYANC